MDAIHDMEKQGTISPEDLSLVKFTDDIDEAMQFISTYISKHYSIRPRKRHWWLLEKR
jgi:predicted Rossmann-fold nucleotide-binding protein